MRPSTLRRMAVSGGVVIALGIAGTPNATAEPVEPELTCEWVTPAPPETTTTEETTTTTETTTTETTVEPIYVCEAETEAPPVTVAAVPETSTESTTTTTPSVSGTTSSKAVGGTSSSSAPSSSQTSAPASSPSGSPSSTPLSTVPIAAPAKAVAPAAAASILTISAGSPLIGPATIAPGQTWTGTMNLSVTNVGVENWVSTVSLSQIRGRNTGSVVSPTSATYSAPATSCLVVLGTSSAVQVNLSSTPTNGKKGIPLCVTSWTATVTVGVPATGVLTDTYEATLTHSIF